MHQKSEKGKLLQFPLSSNVTGLQYCFTSPQPLAAVLQFLPFHWPNLDGLGDEQTSLSFVWRGGMYRSGKGVRVDTGWGKGSILGRVFVGVTLGGLGKDRGRVLYLGGCWNLLAFELGGRYGVSWAELGVGVTLVLEVLRPVESESFY